MAHHPNPAIDAQEHVQPQPASKTTSPPSDIEPAPAPLGPLSQAEVHHALDLIVDGVTGCYRKQVDASGVRFTVESSLSISIGKDGSIEWAAFAPPLSPTLMSCAEQAVKHVRLRPSTVATDAVVPIRLSP
jgi:hypothetical protein